MIYYIFMSIVDDTSMMRDQMMMGMGGGEL